MAIHFPTAAATYRNIPKTGTTSFKHWARDHVPGCEILDDPIRPYNMLHLTLDQIKDRWHNYGTTFTFVRNPYSRMVSIFHHVGQDAEERMKRRLIGGTTEQYGVKQIELDAVPIETDIKILSIYKKGFENWVLSSTSRPNDTSMLSLLTERETQMTWLDGIVPDIVIKIEEVNTKFHIIQELLGCQVPFPHINQSNHADYREYYTPRTKQVVADMFKDDFDAFGYDY